MLDSFEYDYSLDDGSTGTLKATVKSKEVQGNFINVTLILANSLMVAHQITRFRIKDKSGTVICEFDVSISINATQTILVIFTVSYQEV